MKNLNIGVDIDGVLGDFNAVYWLWHNKKFGTNIDPVTDCIDYDYSKILAAKGFDVYLQTEVDRIYKFLSDSKHVLSIPVIPDAKQGVKQLSEIADLYVITSRFTDFKISTEEWVQKNFPGVFKDVISTGSSYGVSKSSSTKAIIGEQLNLDWMIEDAIYHAKEMLEINVQTILLEQPWNKNVKLEDSLLYKADSWKKVPKIISSKSDICLL